MNADASLQIACPHCNALNRVPGDRLGDGVGGNWKIAKP